MASVINNSQDPLLLIGAIIPDSRVTNTVNRDSLHGPENAEKFAKTVTEKYPELTLFAKGVIAHNILDDLAHLKYLVTPGYAYQNNQKLVEIVANFYQLDPKNAARIAHNYIESAVDIMLLQAHPEVQSHLRLAASQVDRAAIVQLLTNAFHLEQTQVENGLDKYLTLFTKYDFVEISNWPLFWGELELLLGLKPTSVPQRRELIDAAIQVVGQTWEAFLKYAIDNNLAPR